MSGKDPGAGEHPPLEMMPVPLVEVDLTGTVRDWNAEAADLLGWAASSDQTTNVVPALLPSGGTQPLWFSRLREAALAGGAARARLCRRSPRLHVSVRATVLRGRRGEATGLLLCFEDASRLRRLRQTLRASERRYHELVELIPDAVVVHDLDRVLFANHATCVLMGANSPAQLIGRRILDFVHPGSAELVEQRRRQLAGGEPVGLAEQKLIRLDGQVVDVEVAGIPVTFEGRSAVQLVVRDITGRKRAEAGLRASQERFRLLTEGVRDYAILMLDREGLIVSWNSGAERMTGHRADEAIRRHFGELFPEAEPQPGGGPDAMLRSAANKGRYEEEGWRLRKDGSPFWASIAITALFNPDRAIVGFAKIVRDLTERRETEAALRRSEDHLRQAQKMEAIGRLAGGIAHDFNNLLTAIQGHAQFLIEDLPEAQSTHGDALEIKRAADRASALTRQLLAFSRRQVLQPLVLDLNLVVRDMHKLLRRVIREDIELTTQLEDELGSICADAGQVEQVLMNLVVNARDAMPTGGRLTIQTRNVELDATPDARGTRLTAGRYVQLAVSDTGVGMDRETQTKIFEPFFTTKPEGEGTGLGLATVYGIVRQSGGHISVYSEPGRGTTFKVFLPVVTDEDTPRRDPAAAELARGSEAVLIVEDDPAIRGMVTRTLQDRGYSVLEAESGQEALRLAAEYDGPIDLMLTDVIMPEMSGRRLAESLLAMQPSARVLFISGFTPEDVVSQGLLDPGARFLEKPFSGDGLARRVREALDEER